MIRDIGLVAAALVLTVLAHFGLALSPTDPLRSTVALLPLIVTALLGVGRWARERGGLPTPEKVAAGEVAILILLTAITLGRHHLGLGPAELVDRVLVGGFAVSLMHRLYWLLKALGPSLGDELPRFAPAPFFVLPFVVYLALLPWTTTQRPPDGDAPHYLLLTHSLAYDFDTDLRNNYARGDSLKFMNLRLEPQLGDPEGAQGQLYSRHNILIPLILAPFYRLSGLMGALLVMAAMTAITCWLTLSLARCYDPDLPGEAVVAWAVLTFTAPFLLFSYQVWVEIPAALLATTGLIQIHRLRYEESLSPWNQTLLFGSLLLLPLVKIRFLLISVPLACLALLKGNRRSRLGATILLVSLLMLAGGILMFNQRAFQNPLKYHDMDGLLSYYKPAEQYLQGAMGLFFDCAFGLFANAPIWILLIPAIAVMVRERHPALVGSGLAFLPYLIALSPRGEWFGGWSPPFRYGVVMIPMLAVWLIPLFRQRRQASHGWLIALLLVLTLVLTTFWLAVPGWTFNLAHGRSHLLDQLSMQVAADVARFLPSSTRVRAATFIWPLTLFVLTIVWLRKRRTAHRSALLWGVSLALLSPAVLVWASQHRPTHIIEFEDPWIAPHQGSVYPDLWVVYRPRYRGGWSLPDGASIPVPVVAGGDRLDLEIDLQLTPENGSVGALEVRDEAGRVLGRTVSDQFGEWITMSFEGLPWSEGRSLTLNFDGSENRDSVPSVALLDRATLTWN